MFEPPVPPAPFCLFLDFDGTLVELCDHPGAVVVPADLRATLAALAERLDGALALVSGRSVADLATRIAPLQLPLGGVHGLERLGADGRRLDNGNCPPSLEAAKRAVHELVTADPRLFAEDKGSAVALHYRMAPDRGGDVETWMRHQCQRIGPPARLQYGKAVVELVLGEGTKADAVSDFLAETPFRDRNPIFVGDDTTDEPALQRVNELGGVAIHVGDRGDTCAPYRLPDVAAVHDWLRRLIQRPDTTLATKT